MEKAKGQYGETILKTNGPTAVTFQNTVQTKGSMDWPWEIRFAPYVCSP